MTRTDVREPVLSRIVSAIRRRRRTVAQVSGSLVRSAGYIESMRAALSYCRLRATRRSPLSARSCYSPARCTARRTSKNNATRMYKDDGISVSIVCICGSLLSNLFPLTITLSLSLSLSLFLSLSLSFLLLFCFTFFHRSRARKMQNAPRACLCIFVALKPLYAFIVIVRHRTPGSLSFRPAAGHADQRQAEPSELCSGGN